MNDGSPQPLLRVVHGGEPSAEEVAAVVLAVRLAQAESDADADSRPATGRWADRHAGLRLAPAAGKGAWRASGRAPGTRTRAGW